MTVSSGIAADLPSIAPYTIEEAYEVADAIDAGDLAHLKDELGDLLFKSCSMPKWRPSRVLSISRGGRIGLRQARAAIRMC